MTSPPIQPAWLDHAWADLGVAEISGPKSSPRVLACFRDSGHAEITSDETAWCAAFVGASLARAGVAPTGSLMARSYLGWGQRCSPPRPGAVAVFSRGSDPALGHVAFFLAAAGDDVVVLGGNQSDAVTVARYPRSRLLDLRWPGEIAAAGPTPPVSAQAPDGSVFSRALAHVLEMEGGWSDDPHDPGGPTNLGITLATYAAWTKRTVTAESFPDLRTELRRLVPADATPIYRERYWGPCGAGELPSSLAFFHFDTAVNHGVTGAARMLQEALGVAVDGEIGPITLAAAGSARLPRLLQTYAEVRRARYRALPHFWRFGRGWLARVDRTLAAAQAITGRAISQSATSKETSMTDSADTSQTSPGDTKWWGNSLTIWGTIVTALSTVLPVLGPLVGLDLSAELVRQLGQGVAQAIQAIGGVIGTVMAILGRARAAQPLMRRNITVRL